uniref:gliding motility lipoprotein GldB n=1 Tax=Psychroflexus aurantiacus TaxID=2709310 RepID=UPI001F3361B5|nr:gliding motility lipoprotein GldB [Psychroflexus aurantiacus]
MILSSCDKASKLNSEAEALEVDLHVERFDLRFAEASPEDLPALKSEYSMLFPDQISDSLWIAKMQSDLQQEIHAEVYKEFPEFKEETERMQRFFKYVKYYFPEYELPVVYTLAEEVNYRQKLVLTQDMLLISLDNYLGRDHEFYKGLPQYIAFQQDEEFLVSDIARALAMQKLSTDRSRTFLSDMIYYGKILYLKDLLMPFESDAAKIYYSEEELTWAEENETQIWSFFVERDLIYSTDIRLEDRFINLSPYSKFYLELDNESSPRIGQYIGWQILRAYMDKYPNTSIKELLELKSDVIFKKSNYKPKS